MKATTLKFPKIVSYQADNKEFSWKLQAANGQPIATPHETFTRKSYIKKSTKKVAEGMLLALGVDDAALVIEAAIKKFGKEYFKKETDAK